MAEKIPLIEPVIGPEEIENIKAVLDSGYMTQGPYAQEFEAKFAELVDADHAISVTSCTTGLVMSLDVLGVGEGDEVIVPSFTHPASANAVVQVGAEPVLVDVDRDSYNINYEQVKEGITDDTAAIMPVSWGGQPLDHTTLNDIADDNDLHVVEDAACSTLAAYDGVPVGSQFDVSVFSFHPRKVLTTGEGGMVTTDDDALESELRLYKNFGTNPRTSVGFIRANATNYRLSDILAAVGVAQVEKIDDIVDTRRTLAHRYTDLLEDIDGVRPPTEPEPARHNFQSYCVYVETGDDDTRDNLIQTMAEYDIETQIGTFSLHNTQAFGDAKRVSDLKVSAALESNLLTLPIAHSMTESDQYRVVETLDEALDEHR